MYLIPLYIDTSVFKGIQEQLEYMVLPPRVRIDKNQCFRTGFLFWELGQTCLRLCGQNKNQASGLGFCLHHV